MNQLGNIEVYIRDCPSERLLALIASVGGPLGDRGPTGEAWAYPGAGVPFILTQGVGAGSYTGVCFAAPPGP